MKIVNKLTLRHLKENKGRTVVTTLGICVSVAMITAVFVAAASLMNLFGEIRDILDFLFDILDVLLDLVQPIIDVFDFLQDLVDNLFHFSFPSKKVVFELVIILNQFIELIPQGLQLFQQGHAVIKQKRYCVLVAAKKFVKIKWETMHKLSSIIQ